MPPYSPKKTYCSPFTAPWAKTNCCSKISKAKNNSLAYFTSNLELLSESRNLDFQAILGQPLTVQIQFAPEHTRYLNGIVTRFAQADTDSRFTTYYADLRPWLWQLTLTQNCRIFQNLSVPDIIKKVFTDLGFLDYRFQLVRSDYYEPRIYCVQYQETAFNFVSRLMTWEYSTSLNTRKIDMFWYLSMT